MLFKKRNKVPPHKKYRQRIKPHRSVGRYVDLALIGLTFTVVLLLGSTAIRLMRAETKELPQEIVVLRTQVANGCGASGVAARFADWVAGKSDEFFKFDIIDIGNFEHSAIPQTMVLVRNPRMMLKADRMAARLGIARENVVLAELEDNFLAVDVTVVIGKDYKEFQDGPALLATEILNGCGISGAARKFSPFLKTVEEEALAFKIDREENYGSFDVGESLLIIKSKKAERMASRLAEALQIKKNNILYENQGKDQPEIDLTIVIGRDWARKLSIN